MNGPDAIGFDDAALTRIIESTRITPLPQVDTRQLRNDLLTAEARYRADIDLRERRKLQQAMTLLSTSARRTRAYFKPEIWEEISADWPLTVPSPEVALDYLIQATSRRLTQMDAKSSIPTHGKSGSERAKIEKDERRAADLLRADSAEESALRLVCRDLSSIFDRYFPGHGTGARNNGKAAGPRPRFVTQALFELSIKNTRRKRGQRAEIPYSIETVLHELRDIKTGRSRERRRKLAR
jgi:hypothetical protein